MSHRLQVLIPPELDAQIEKAAQRCRVSKSEWMRRALQCAVGWCGKRKAGADPLAQLGALNAPTADLEQMLAEIGSGRS